MFHHINYGLVWSRQPEVCTFTPVNSKNKRQNYDNSWNHIEVCKEKWCRMTNHLVCNKNNTTWINSGTGTYFLSGTWVRPFLCTLLFRVSAIFGYTFHFFPFSVVHIFRYCLYLHNFHVRWRITSGAGTANPFARPELSPGCVKGSYWYIFICVWLYV